MSVGMVMLEEEGAGLLVSVTASLTANSRSGDGCLFSQSNHCFCCAGAIL